ncbi:chitobiase/beta-hexosaminidase C-terminal domain-containing protein [Lachnobacterium bovis]|uniref:Zinc-ribbon domain-containing protein n=1 Tax=Lachnobacterium bovis TaxID=140626 RepID=A0A1H9Q267_9FIRM|nr:chitobiase/beta-hexosaminidase C-terminal domain-containing protein [Lachnobacterium bovis]SER53963.1 zinc-ribbon domain-containing protein [Lachnobacterium bovis]
MKCKKCGNDLQDGTIYCPKCGKEVQIVPDYNEFDEEYLKNLIMQEQINDSFVENDRISSDEISIYPGNKKGRIIILGGMITAIVLAIAVVVYTSITNYHLNSYDYQISKGKEAVKEKNYDLAIKYYNKAAEINKTKAYPLYELGKIYEKQNEYATAEDMYKKSIELNNKYVSAYKHIIKLYEKNEELNKIVELSKSVNNSKIKALFSEYIAIEPSFNSDTEVFYNKINLQLSIANKTDVVYYTIDGKDPTKDGIVYNDKDGIVIRTPGTYYIKAVSKNKKGIYSQIVGKSCKLVLLKPDQPVVSPSSGSYGAPTYITISVPDGCEAYYTWDGQVPTRNSEKYTNPILVPEGNNVLNVISVDIKTGRVSDTYSAYYEYYAQE